MAQTRRPVGKHGRPNRPPQAWYGCMVEAFDLATRKNSLQGSFSIKSGIGAYLWVVPPRNCRSQALWCFQAQPGVTVPRVMARTEPFTQIPARSEEHTSGLQSLMRISYAVFCLKTKINNTLHNPLLKPT